MTWVSARVSHWKSLIVQTTNPMPNHMRLPPRTPLLMTMARRYASIRCA